MNSPFSGQKMEGASVRVHRHFPFLVRHTLNPVRDMRPDNWISRNVINRGETCDRMTNRAVLSISLPPMIQTPAGSAASHPTTRRGDVIATSPRQDRLEQDMMPA